MGIFDAAPGAMHAHTMEIHRESWRDGEVVVVRVRVTPEDEQWVTNQLIKRISSVRGGLSTVNQLAFADKFWLQRLIVSWTLTKNGQPLPFCADSIDALPKEERDFLVKQIWAKQPEKSMRTGLSRSRKQRDFDGAAQARLEQFQSIEK